MDFEVQNELQQSISHDERLLWTGKPKSGIRFRPSDIAVTLFGVVWLGFAVFWTLMAWKSGTFMYVFGLPFLLVGVFLLIGRFFVDALKRKYTIYGITADRVIIKSGIFSKEIKSFSINNMTELTLNEKPDGSGSVYFGPVGINQNRIIFNDSDMMQRSRSVLGLEFIDDAKKVYDIIVHAQKNM